VLNAAAFYYTLLNFNLKRVATADPHSAAVFARAYWCFFGPFSFTKPSFTNAVTCGVKKNIGSVLRSRFDWTPHVYDPLSDGVGLRLA